MEVTEKINKGETPMNYVTRVAMDKAIFSAHLLRDESIENHPILCADTIVRVKNKIYLKPRDRSDVVDMLTELSNKKHEVITSVVLAIPIRNQSYSFKFDQVTNTTSVKFSKIPPSWIQHYSKTKEPMDKSGSYGIQERGSIFIKEISGSYSSVVGLPIHETYQLLFKYF